MDENTKQLIKKMQLGDEQALNKLYEKYSGKLYRTVYLITRNKEDSEDILQETFIKCYLHCNEIKTPEYFESWLMKIMLRISWRMVKQRKKLVSSDELLENNEYVGFAESLFEDKTAKMPLDQIVIKERHSTVINSINSLDFKFKTVIVLYYYQQLSVGEIAKIIGKPEGTIKSRLHTGRVKLKKMLTKKNNETVEERREVLWVSS